EGSGLRKCAPDVLAGSTALLSSYLLAAVADGVDGQKPVFGCERTEAHFQGNLTAVLMISDRFGPSASRLGAGHTETRQRIARVVADLLAYQSVCRFSQ